jgi:hypothetical protein
VLTCVVIACILAYRHTRIQVGRVRRSRFARLDSHLMYVKLPRS